MKKSIKTKAANLRQKAEELLIKKSLKTDSQLSETEILKLIHEFEVHKIELEMQNEQLILALSNAEDAIAKAGPIDHPWPVRLQLTYVT